MRRTLNSEREARRATGRPGAHRLPRRRRLRLVETYGLLPWADFRAGDRHRAPRSGIRARARRGRLPPLHYTGARRARRAPSRAFATWAALRVLERPGLDRLSSVANSGRFL